MALCQKAGWLILASALAVHAAEFPVRHAHWRKACAGIMTVDEVRATLGLDPMKGKAVVPLTDVVKKKT